MSKDEIMVQIDLLLEQLWANGVAAGSAGGGISQEQLDAAVAAARLSGKEEGVAEEKARIIALISGS